MNVYLDYTATTPPHPEVLRAMREWDDHHYGNASSPHRFGQQAKAQLELTRQNIADAISARPKEICFTSGGTEANNMALIGAATANRHLGNHLLISGIEHPSVLQAAGYLSEAGFDVEFMNPQPEGVISLDDLAQRIRPQTILVSVMYVNNETGLVQPVETIAALCREENVLFHCDAVQALGKLPVNLGQLQADLCSFSAHKIYGPKGIGALFIREGTALDAILFGGGQEANRRPGTENMTAVIGFGASLSRCTEHLKQYSQIKELRGRFEDEIMHRLPFAQIIGQEQDRSPYISSIAFPGLSNESLLFNLDMAGIAVSVGSACSSGSIKQSHVLQAMKLSDPIINSTLRFSFGLPTTWTELEYTLDKLTTIAERLRK